MSNYLTPDMVADELGNTAKTIRDWLRSGELVGIKVGNSWRVHRSDLERYLEGQRLVILLNRIRNKHPNVDWIEGCCAQCGEYIPVPNNNRPIVCSPSCKNVYDRAAAAVVGVGTPEFIECAAEVLPYY